MAFNSTVITFNSLGIMICNYDNKKVIQELNLENIFFNDQNTKGYLYFHFYLYTETHIISFYSYIQRNSTIKDLIDFIRLQSNMENYQFKIVYIFENIDINTRIKTILDKPNGKHYPTKIIGSKDGSFSNQAKLELQSVLTIIEQPIYIGNLIQKVELEKFRNIKKVIKCKKFD